MKNVKEKRRQKREKTTERGAQKREEPPDSKRENGMYDKRSSEEKAKRWRIRKLMKKRE